MHIPHRKKPLKYRVHHVSVICKVSILGLIRHTTYIVNKWTDLLPSGSGVMACGLLSGSAGGVCNRGPGVVLAISSADLTRDK